jgi:osmotically-inducible protein OsmY
MSAHDRRSTGVQTDDETPNGRPPNVPERFKAASHVNFTAYNHRLLITGEVPSDEARTVIGEQTRQVPGVTGFSTN